MSAQQQQQKQGSNSKRELEADFLFNQHIVRTVGYTAAGFGFGLATSLLFKHKAGMTMFFSGVGAGYGASNFVNDLSTFRKYKNLGQSVGQNQSQRQNYGFDQLERGGSQLSEGLQYAKNQAKGAAQQAQNKLSEGAQNLKEQGRDVADQAKNAASEAYNRVSEGAQHAKDQAKNASGQAKNATENLQNKASEGLQHAKEQAKNAAENLQNKASEGLKNAKDQAKNAAENLQNKASEGAQHAKDQAKNVAGQAKSAAENLQNKASEGLKNAKDQAKNVAENLQNKASEGAQHAKDQAKNAAENLQNKASEGLKNAKDQAKNAAENLQNKASEGAQHAKDQAKNAAENAKNKASEATHNTKEQAKQYEEQARKKIEDSVPNLKEQGKESAGGTSRNAGGDPYNKSTFDEAERNAQIAKNVAEKQKAQNQTAHGSGTSAQGDANKDSVERVNGQTFQSFDSNSHKEGKKGMIHEIQTNYQENRNRFREQAGDADRRTKVSQDQDPYFQSETEGNSMVNEMTKSETLQGAHNYKKGAGEQATKNQVNAHA